MAGVIKWLLLAPAILFVLCGCSKDIPVEIFNNTGLPVGRMFGEQQSIIIENHSFYRPSSIEFTRGIAFRIDGKIFNYKFPSIDISRHFNLFKGGILRLQLNPDGRIFAVTPNAQLPTSQYPEQPDNFPVEPIK